jgi:hypothetical protein
MQPSNTGGTLSETGGNGSSGAASGGSPPDEVETDHSLDVVVTGDATGTMLAFDAGFEITTGVATGDGGLVALSGHTHLLIEATNAISPGEPTVALYTVDGQHLWSSGIVLGGEGEGRAGDVAIGASGSVYAVSQMGSYPTYRTVVTKFYPDGAIDWTTNLEGLGDVGGPGLALDADENVYLSGALTDQLADGTSTSFASLTRFDSDGRFAWQKPWMGEPSFGTDVGVDAQGDVYVSASIQGVYDAVRGSAAMSPLLLKFNAAGDVLWESQWVTDLVDKLAWSLYVDEDGSSWVSGVSWVDDGGAGLPPEPVFVAKHDAAGKLLWMNETGLLARTAEFSTSLALAPDGTLLVATTKEDEVDYLKSLATVAWLSPEGTPQGGETWDPDAETTYAVGVAFDSFGHGIVAGSIRIAGADGEESTFGAYFRRFP